jgi:hypothetical protein
MATTWERKAQAVISKTIAHLRRDIESGQISEAELRRILSKKYPFGERAHHPYSVWRRCVDGAIADAFGDETQLDLFA